MRIHLITEGSRGDVQPMVVLGEALAERAAGLGAALRAGDAGREALRRKVLD